MTERIKVTMLTGELRLDEPRYHIEERDDGPYLVGKFGSLGPFANRVDIMMAARRAGMRLERD